MAEKKIGEISHYYGQIGVVAFEVTGTLAVGDTIHIKGHTSDFTTEVESIQVAHEQVESAKKGISVGIKVSERARGGDEVFKVTED